MAFEVPVMHLDKILFGGAESRRKPPNIAPELTLTEGQNGTKKISVELNELRTPKDEESVEENGVHHPEQREPFIEQKWLFNMPNK